jgi:hypothetical protein
VENCVCDGCDYLLLAVGKGCSAESLCDYVEPEVCFADINDNIDLAEDYLKFCVQYALEHCSDDLVGHTCA